eukprot:1153080-Pelagomonas_calceolata.AAC.3
MGSSSIHRKFGLKRFHFRVVSNCACALQLTSARSLKRKPLGTLKISFPYFVTKTALGTLKPLPQHSKAAHAMALNGTGYPTTLPSDGAHKQHTCWAHAAQEARLPGPGVTTAPKARDQQVVRQCFGASLAHTHTTNVHVLTQLSPLAQAAAVIWPPAGPGAGSLPWREPLTPRSSRASP